MAHQKETTANPGTIAATSIIIKAFTTKVKRPNVIKLMGKVRIKMRGLTNIFKIPKTIATTVATQKLGKIIPADNI